MHLSLSTSASLGLYTAVEGELAYDYCSLAAGYVYGYL
jgi:hypothetical protein